MDLKEIKTATTAAATAAKQLVADKHQGQSPFGASIRSALDHANELLGHHEKWLAANPEKPAAK